MCIRDRDLYVCLRPVRYYQGTPSPVKHPELTDMVIFRENSEDIYAGIEWKADSAEADKVIKFLRDEMGVKKIRFPEHCGIGIKPCSEAVSYTHLTAKLTVMLHSRPSTLARTRCSSRRSITAVSYTHLPQRRCR